MENEKVFKTKTGFCHILPDKIILTRDGIIGNASKVFVGNGIHKLLIIYSLISISLLYFAYLDFQKGKNISTLFFSAFALFLIYGIVTSVNNSATPVIERQKIKEIILKKAILGLTRSRFEVFFEDEKGKIKKRIIMLPGSLTDGQNETENAIKIMMEERLIKPQ